MARRKGALQHLDSNGGEFGKNTRGQEERQFTNKHDSIPDHDPHCILSGNGRAEPAHQPAYTRLALGAWTMFDELLAAATFNQIRRPQP